MVKAVLLHAGYTMTAIDTDVSQVRQMFDVNVFGPIRMVHTFHPWLIRAQGCVVNIGSVGGIVPYMYGCESSGKIYHEEGVADLEPAASYNASKAALHHWGNTLRVEMSPLGSVVASLHLYHHLPS